MANCRPFTDSCFVEMSLIGSHLDVKFDRKGDPND